MFSIEPVSGDRQTWTNNSVVYNKEWLKKGLWYILIFSARQYGRSEEEQEAEERKSSDSFQSKECFLGNDVERNVMNSEEKKKHRATNVISKSSSANVKQNASLYANHQPKHTIKLMFKTHGQ